MQASKEKTKKRIILAIAITLGVLLITYVLTVVLEFVKTGVGGSPSAPDDESIIFPPPDYDENIFDDVVYLSYDKDIMYTKGGYGITIDSKDVEDEDEVVQFFYNYFQTVINGEYEKYASFFTQSYRERDLLPKKFTMQKIYDIDIRFFSRELKSEAPTIYLDTYEIRYKIRNNNGTLRSDVESDTTKPIVFELVVENKDVRIDDIYPIKTMIIPDE